MGHGHTYGYGDGHGHGHTYGHGHGSRWVAFFRSEQKGPETGSRLVSSFKEDRGEGELLDFGGEMTRFPYGGADPRANFTGGARLFFFVKSPCRNVKRDLSFLQGERRCENG